MKNPFFTWTIKAATIVSIPIPKAATQLSTLTIKAMRQGGKYSRDMLHAGHEINRRGKSKPVEPPKYFLHSIRERDDSKSQP